MQGNFVMIWSSIAVFVCFFFKSHGKAGSVGKFREPLKLPLLAVAAWDFGWTLSLLLYDRPFLQMHRVDKSKAENPRISVFYCIFFYGSKGKVAWNSHSSIWMGILCRTGEDFLGPISNMVNPFVISVMSWMKKVSSERKSATFFPVTTQCLCEEQRDYKDDVIVTIVARRKLSPTLS